MNANLIQSMTNNIALLDKFDFSFIDPRDTEIRERVTELRNLCNIYREYELGLLAD